MGNHKLKQFCTIHKTQRSTYITAFQGDTGISHHKNEASASLPPHPYP